MNEETELWKLPVANKATRRGDRAAPEARHGPDVDMTEEDAERLVDETRRILDESGYCLWKCHGLSDAVICVMDDILPAGSWTGGHAQHLAQLVRYPVYTQVN